MNTKPDKIDSLQALRFIAYTLIFLCHCCVSEQFGQFGVSIFFILSGFVMTLQYSKREISARQCLKKILKLYPLHFLTMSAAVMLYLYQQNYGYLKSRILTHGLLVHAWIPIKKLHVSLNCVDWFLSASVFLYLVFPYILKKLKNIQNTPSIFLLATGIYLVQLLASYGISCIARLPFIAEAFPHFVKWGIYYFPLMRLADFSVGCCLGYAYSSVSQSPSHKNLPSLRKWHFTTLEVALLIVIILEFAVVCRLPEWMHYTILYTPTAALLILLFVFKKGFLSGILTNRITIGIGNISSVTFLVHFQIINWCMTLFFDAYTLGTIIIMYFLTLIISIGYMRFYEFVRKIR